ncbi:hypothetical protein CW751_04120 [Brumimicrobium salinarum]|uniref:Glycosyltransferase RgtA/B/C/D-like domain-containing protein n=1 Tax=Brumimicrobium salinarum TaxID=2058658 RepID=A0A2I0R555_9FLAO|nr:hypothetical protein [Brumimicrobium salinarum]PKR81721.1 hypothetical protein CW751_04120 [Brumimicrobium salinarum]
MNVSNSLNGISISFVFLWKGDVLGIPLIIVYILLLLGFSYWLNKKYIPELSNLSLPVLFLCKFCFALFFLYVYTYHYGGGELTADAGMFFRESKLLYEVFNESPHAFFQFLFGLNNDIDFINQYLQETTHWNGGDRFLPNDSRHVIRVNALIHFISTGQVVIHFLILSFFSFLGGFDLFQWLKKKSTIPPLGLLVMLTLAPSLAFWGSSIIKEPLMILGTCILIRGVFDEISIKNRVWRIVLGLILTFAFKPYVVICLLMALIYYYLLSPFFKRQWLAMLFFAGLGIGTLIVTNYSDKMAYVIANQQEDFINLRDGGLYLYGDNDHIYYIYYAHRKYFSFENDSATLKEPVDAFYMEKNENFKRYPIKLIDVGKSYPVYLSLAETGSSVDVTLIEDSFGQLLLNIPEALFNSFLQPIPNKKSTWLQFSAFFENILYLIMAVFTFFIFPRNSSKKENRIIASMSLFALFIAMIVGWTTPVSGAIVRYIVPAHIGILIIFALKLDFKKLKVFTCTRKK